MMQIEELQTRLKELGFDPGPIDGLYGIKTLTALKAFQASRGLAVDGIVGPLTRRALAKPIDAARSLTAQQLADACHIHLATARIWLEPLRAAMARFEINTPARAAAFLAQISHESQRFSRGRENLYYTSKERLLAVFGKRIRPEEAITFMRNPIDLANRVYANRYGNGNEASGDGWRYRGGGPIGLTFRDNYRTCGEAIGFPLESQPDIIQEPHIGALSAAWFWKTHGCNELADRGRFDEITQRINGGQNGAEDRRAMWASAKSALMAA
jgi:putative chitinase